MTTQAANSSSEALISLGGIGGRNGNLVGEAVSQKRQDSHGDQSLENEVARCPLDGSHTEWNRYTKGFLSLCEVHDTRLDHENKRGEMARVIARANGENAQPMTPDEFALRGMNLATFKSELDKATEEYPDALGKYHQLLKTLTDQVRDAVKSITDGKFLEDSAYLTAIVVATRQATGKKFGRQEVSEEIRQITSENSETKAQQHDAWCKIYDHAALESGADIVMPLQLRYDTARKLADANPALYEEMQGTGDPERFFRRLKAQLFELVENETGGERMPRKDYLELVQKHARTLTGEKGEPQKHWKMHQIIGHLKDYAISVVAEETDKSVADLGLSSRVVRTLVDADITTVSKMPKDPTTVSGIGPKAAEEIATALA